jgi:hypothetical protein
MSLILTLTSLWLSTEVSSSSWCDMKNVSTRLIVQVCGSETITVVFFFHAFTITAASKPAGHEYRATVAAKVGVGPTEGVTVCDDIVL